MKGNRIRVVILLQLRRARMWTSWQVGTQSSVTCSVIWRVACLPAYCWHTESVRCSLRLPADASETYNSSEMVEVTSVQASRRSNRWTMDRRRPSPHSSVGLLMYYGYRTAGVGKRARSTTLYLSR